MVDFSSLIAEAKSNNSILAARKKEQAAYNAAKINADEILKPINYCINQMTAETVVDAFGSSYGKEFWETVIADRKGKSSFSRTGFEYKGFLFYLIYDGDKKLFEISWARETTNIPHLDSFLCFGVSNYECSVKEFTDKFKELYNFEIEQSKEGDIQDFNYNIKYSVTFDENSEKLIA